MKRCQKGHLHDKRECPECRKERKKKWAAENPERAKQKRKEEYERSKNEV